MVDPSRKARWKCPVISPPEEAGVEDGVTVELHAVAGDETALRMPARHVELHLELLGLPEIVGVEERDVVAPHHPQPDIAGGREPPVRPPDVDDARSIGGDAGGRVVGGAVVDHDDLAVGMGLGERAL